MVDGINYVPLRLVGEIFGEKVGWDNAKRAPYIDRNGEITEFDCFIEKNSIC
jgi:hypothetical protein